MAAPAGEFQLDQYIMHHIMDSHEWHLPFLPPIHLPEYLSLHSIMLLIAAAILIFFFGFVAKKKESPKGLANVLEFFVLFIRDDVVAPAMGKADANRMTPLFCTFFFFILTLNLMGLIPVFSTATANINVTAGLATITLGFMILGAIYRNGLGGFMKALIPSGVPIPVLFLLVPIEFVGLFIKAFALTVRLFANLMAGHIVIFALLGLVVVVGFTALPSVFLALFIYLLEILVAFIQAYVFTLLSALFIGQIHHPDH